MFEIKIKPLLLKSQKLLKIKLLLKIIVSFRLVLNISRNQWRQKGKQNDPALAKTTGASLMAGENSTAEPPVLGWIFS